ncbi:unnamed protein product [Cyclocybe aegerita]|uniref:BTB domain-containing protein n=1 Tax=Cyclocybe aegerita TaxID=1973307 RepID=A0A8S0VXA3_CYCAE|nr:unnamed protein product [Cyclocybe aegerita]
MLHCPLPLLHERLSAYRAQHPNRSAHSISCTSDPPADMPATTVAAPHVTSRAAERPRGGRNPEDSPRPTIQSTSPRGQSFFASSSGVEVTGSNLRAIQGHHTSLTVNLNQGGVVGDTTTDRSRRIGCQPGQVPMVGSYDEHNGFPVDSLAFSFPTHQRSSEIYARLLAPKGRGFALWIPEPHRNLPTECRRMGVRIGDVGIITPRGSFSLLFNVFNDVDPTHTSLLPEAFVPLEPFLQATDVAKIIEFRPGSYLASSSIERAECGSEVGLTFKTSASEAAVLVMPDGATSEDVENVARIRRYVAANLINWYRFVNGPCGRDARNGDIRIIIGCDKSTSYGIAATTNTTQEMNSQLKFRPLQDDSRSDLPVATYVWEHSGLAEVRAGPDRQEIEELRRGDILIPEDGKYANQCLFLRTINPILGEKEWLKLCQELDTPHLMSGSQHKPASSHDQQGSRRNHSAAPPASRTSNSQQSRQESGSRRVPLSSDFSQQTSNLDPSSGVLMSNLPAGIDFHPSKILNELVLKTVPDARIVISDDSNWSSIFNEGSNGGIPCDENALRQVLESHHIKHEDDGVVFLEDKKSSICPYDTVRRHEEYYLDGGDMHVLVAQRTLFRVHGYFFSRESPVFNEKLRLPGNVLESQTNPRVIMLNDVSPEEFAKFLWVFYNPRYCIYEASIDDWSSILNLADKWGFREVKELAVHELHKKDWSPVRKIALFQKYNVDPRHLVMLYAELCARPTPLTFKESEILGLDATLVVMTMREKLRAKLSEKVQSPLPQGMEEEDVFRVIETTLEMEEGSTKKFREEKLREELSSSPTSGGHHLFSKTG